jgi:hypothetical protein
MKTNFLLNPKFILFIIIVYPLLFIWQGLDVFDVGFSLTSYQEIFNDPESVSFSSFLWLTNIIGGVWLLLFGDSLGLVGANLAGVFVTYMTIIFSYLILKPYIEKRYLLIGLALVLILSRCTLQVIDYDNLTGLFFVASAFFLIKGLKHKGIWQILISGLILGLNIFIRLPNIIGFALIFAIFFYGYIEKLPFKLQIKQGIFFILGYAAAIIITFSVMKILGHYEIYINSIYQLFNNTTYVAEGKLGSDNLKSMLIIFIKEYLKVFGFLAISIMFILPLSKTFSLFKNRYPYYGFIIVISAIVFFLSLEGYNLVRPMIILMVGIMYMILFMYIINMEKSNNHYRLIAFIAFLILFITPLGSASALARAIYAIWLPIPIIITFLFRLKQVGMEIETVSELSSNRFRIGLNEKETYLAKNFVIICFFTFSLLLSFTFINAYSINRFDMRYTIDNPRLKGIFITKEGADSMQEVLDELNKYVKEDDYLFTYEYIMILHFLTKTKPYISCQRAQLYPIARFKGLFNEAMKEKSYLPVVVINNSSLQDKNVYTVVVEEFLDRNHYKPVWKNEIFEILIPSSDKTKASLGEAL